MKHRNSHLMVGYWSRLRRGRATPNQTDIDPRAIKRLLPFVFILDAADPDHPAYRLAGTGLCERFGAELKGTGFFAHWEEDSRASLGSMLRQALAQRQPVCLSAIAATAECGMIEMEITLAPVAFGGHHPTRFMGLVQIVSEASALVRYPVAFLRLVGAQIVREDEPIPAGFDVPPPVQFRPAVLRGHPKAPHLRLIVSQDEPVTRTPQFERLVRLLDVFGTGISPGK